MGGFQIWDSLEKCYRMWRGQDTRGEEKERDGRTWDKGALEVCGGRDAPCVIAGRWWRKEVKRRLDTTKMFLMFEAEKHMRGKEGRGSEAGRPRMKADVRSPEDSSSVKPSNRKEEYI